MNVMNKDETKLGDTFTFPCTSITVHRMDYGAMQLVGRGPMALEELTTLINMSSVARARFANRQFVARRFLDTMN